MKYFKVLAMLFAAAALTFTACGGGGDDGGDGDTVINIKAIPGVTAPVMGAAPVTEITATDQYTGTVAWSDSPLTFAASTVYTATITLTAKDGYTLTGVSDNYFTVAQASPVTNEADSGVVTAVFPETEATINDNQIQGVTAPVLGAIPVTAITATDQYTGTVTWDGGWEWSSRFGGNKAYTATITLTAKAGYTLTGVTADYFSVDGAQSASNGTDSGVITAVFQETASVAVGDSVLGGKVFLILEYGDWAYVSGEQRGLIAATADQPSGGFIPWAVTPYDYHEAVPGGTETYIGYGAQNTDNIIAQNGAGTSYAAGLARAYTGGGYTDWYLPSRYELYELYLQRAVIGGFPGNYYWSSTEYTGANNQAAWLVDFTTGEESGNNKAATCKVRAVRVF